MKEWKGNLAQAIVDEFKSPTTINFPPVGDTDRAVKFSEVAQKCGYKHIDRADIKDIAAQVTRLCAELRPVRVVKDAAHPDAAESAWSTLYFTDLEF